MPYESGDDSTLNLDGYILQRRDPWLRRVRKSDVFECKRGHPSCFIQLDTSFIADINKRLSLDLPTNILEAYHGFGDALHLWYNACQGEEALAHIEQ